MSKIKSFQISSTLAQGLDETISAAQTYSGQLRVEVIRLNNIELDPTNPRDLLIDFNDIQNGVAKSDTFFERKQKELYSLKAMADSIKNQGIINPILVYKLGDKYRLIAGERRALASALAGNIDIQAKILDKKPEEVKLSILQWIENIERENLNLWERLRNLEKIIAAYKQENGVGKEVTPTVLAQIIGCSLQNAMNYCYVLNGDENIKQLIQGNKIQNLEKAALINQIKSVEIKKEAIKACLLGATLKELKNIAISAKKKNEHKRSLVETIKTRGRAAAQVNLGATKNINLVKLIVNSILETEQYKTLKPMFEKIDWNDYGVVTKIFKQFLNKLENK